MRGTSRGKRSRVGMVFLVCALLSVANLACTGGRNGAADPSSIDHSLPPVDVRDDDFAASVHRLLRDGKPTGERSALLAGTVRRQLSHAATFFRQDDHVRGADAVIGALYMVRAGEARPDMFDGDGLFALRGAFRRFSAMGDEGRALALLLAQRATLEPSSPRAAELAEHQAALDRWLAETRPKSAMQRLTVRKRIAVARALLSPSEETLRAAERAINKWVGRAVEINLAYQRTRKAPRRAIILEAYRALQLGSETMAAVFLRHGRATDAVVALDKGSAGRVADGPFFARLQGAANGDSAEDWRLLAKAFRRRAMDDEEVKMDGRLFDAVTWGIALEAYRRDPTSYRIAHVLSDHLASYGMPEVAPLVLADALGHDPTSVALSGVMSVIDASLRERFAAHDSAGAHRIYASAARVFAIADRSRYKGRAKPSSSQIRMTMAHHDLETGHAERARALMVESLQASPSLTGYVELATLERQTGRSGDALNHARRATKLPGAEALPLVVARAHLLAFEVLRDRGDRTGALVELERALQLALANRERGAATHRIRAELVLARTLHGYGDQSKAQQSLQRALALAEGHGVMLGEVVTAAVAHAFAHGDVEAARAALQWGFKAHVDDEAMIRAALWLMLVETELSVSSDGKVDRVLSAAAEGHGWWHMAARWGSNLVSDATLRQASKTRAEKVRAEFYVAMRARAKRRSSANEAGIRTIANDPLFWEPEVNLARALLAPRMSAPIPQAASIP